MQREEVEMALQSILVQHFNIAPDQFSWEKPMDALQEDFKSLSYLMFLEQLLQQQFGKNIRLLETISTAFHTPKDIVQHILSI